MTTFFDRMNPDNALEIDRISRLVYELRVNRKHILDSWQVRDEEQLLVGMLGGTVPEHPGYEAWLGARALGDAHQQARELLAASLAQAQFGAAAPPPAKAAAPPVRAADAGAPNLHPALAEAIARDFTADLVRPPTLHQDAVVFALANGIDLIVRYRDATAYSLRWIRAGRECGIDTAPLHDKLATFPNHLHDASGTLRADPLTDPAAHPVDNVARVLRALLDDPALSGGAA